MGKGRNRNKAISSPTPSGSSAPAPAEQPSLTGNEKADRDIFIDIEPTVRTSLLVTEQPTPPPPPQQEQQPPQQLSEPQQQPDLQSTPQAPQQVDSPKTDDEIPSVIRVDTATQSATSNTTDFDDTSDMPTLTRLSTPNGSEVYLVGTAHFSQKSVEDVQKVIRAVRPSAVVLELCPERAFMLSLDEQSLLEQNRNLTFEKIRNAIAEKGLAQGLIFIIFIKMSANLTEKLGMAPGSEFRAGSNEASKIPGCRVVLGDRSLKVTVARAVASVSLWQKMKLIYQVLICNVSVTEEDVENCKDKDMLEQMLQELGVEFPGFKRTILDERNVYLAHSIYRWAQMSETSMGPQRLVALVGIGHVAGIVENWGKTTDEDIRMLNEIPKSSKTRRIVTKTIKYCSLALIIYVGYRAFTPTSIQTAIYDRITNRQ